MPGLTPSLLLSPPPKAAQQQDAVRSILQANSAIPHFAGAVKTSCPHFVDDVKTFCIPCSSNKPEPVRTSGDLSVTFTSSDDSNNEQDKGSDDEQDEGSDDEQHAGTKDKKDEDSDDEQDEGSDDKNPVSTKCFSEDVFGSSSSDDVNPSRDDNIDGSADDQDKQAKDSDIDEASANDTESDNDKERDHDMERDNDKDSVIDNESDHDMERENDEDNNLDAESHMFVWCSTNNMWVKQNVHDGSFDDLEYDLIQHTVHNVYQYVFIKPADFTTMLLTMSTEPLCFALCHNSNDGTNYAIA